LIWGYNMDISLGKKISVTIIATGFKTDIIPELYVQETKQKEIIEIEKRPYKQILNTYDDIEIEVNYTKDEEFIVSKPETSNPIKKKENEYEYEKKELSKIQEKIKIEAEKNENTAEEEERVRKALERIKLLEKVNPQKPIQKINRIERSAKSIDELENEPAFKRKNIDINNEMSYKGKEISRYNLTEDDDEEDYDISENSFLHDNVD
jgi:cell division protein FtsZ